MGSNSLSWCVCYSILILKINKIFKRERREGSIPYMGERQVPAIADPPFQTYSVSLTIVLTVSLYRTAELELESGNFELYLILHTHFLPCDDTLILKYLLHSKRLELLLTFGLQWQVKNIPWGYLRFKTYNLQYAQPVCLFYLEENSLSPSLICLGLPMKSTLQLQLKYRINF